MGMVITLTVNKITMKKELTENDDIFLLRYLRDELGLMGTKNGCEKGHCGACTVIINGDAKRSCIVKLSRLDGAIIETIEGLSHGEKLHYIQQAYIDEGAVQCGFCTPGMIMSTKALLDKVDNPDDEQIKEALKDNVCRCTGYAGIVRAVKRSAKYKKYYEDDGYSIKNYNYVGIGVPRIDGIKKVTGAPIYADDYTADGMVYGKLVFSKYAHGLVKKIDISKAQALEGVVLVLTGNDIPGINAFGVFTKEQPVLIKENEEVKYLGAAVAAVFAENEKIAIKATKLIEVEYEVLPALLDPLEAFKEGSQLVNKNKENNIVHEVHAKKGNVEEGFKKADIIVEGHYYTPAVEHAYLETESCLALPTDEDGVEVYTGSQGSISFQENIAINLNMPMEKVRVIYTPCGGGFGGKEETTVQIHACLAAVILKRPVKMTLSREESIRISTKRHPMHIWMKHGATKDGKIVAVKSKVIGDSGAYESATKPVIFRSAVTASGPYVVENFQADSYGVATHNNPKGAFRGFGSTQPSFACEIQIDKLARKLNMDPAELRRINGIDEGKKTGTGQKLTGGTGYLKTLEAVSDGMKRIRNRFKPSGSKKKIGFGIASSYKNVGIGTGILDDAKAAIELMEDGRIQVRIGAADMGQGCDTICAQIAATVLKVPYECIEIVANDTKICPDGGMTTASRQTYVTGNAVKITSESVKPKLSFYLKLAVESEEIKFHKNHTNHEGEIIITKSLLKKAYDLCKDNNDSILDEKDYIPPKTYPHKICGDLIPGMKEEEFKIHYAYCFVSAGAVVEVDTDTGEVKVLKVLAAQDVGKAINPKNVTGQIEGSVLMGMGMALSEEFIETDEKVITDNLFKIGIPKIKSMPEIETFTIEVSEPEGPFGAKGMGEVGLNPVISAISNAVYDAVGVRIQELPMKRDKVLKAIKNKETEKVDY